MLSIHASRFRCVLEYYWCSLQPGYEAVPLVATGVRRGYCERLAVFAQQQLVIRVRTVTLIEEAFATKFHNQFLHHDNGSILLSQQGRAYYCLCKTIKFAAKHFFNGPRCITQWTGSSFDLKNWCICVFVHMTMSESKSSGYIVLLTTPKVCKIRPHGRFNFLYAKTTICPDGSVIIELGCRCSSNIRPWLQLMA